VEDEMADKFKKVGRAHAITAAAIRNCSQLNSFLFNEETKSILP